MRRKFSVILVMSLILSSIFNLTALPVWAESESGSAQSSQSSSAPESSAQNGEQGGVKRFDPETDITSRGAYMVNLDTDTLVWEKASNEKMYPASLTKIVTAIVVLENCADLQALASGPAELWNEFQNINISHAGILPGEELTIESLLYAMLVQSANEAAKIAAYYVGDGDVDAFVEMMNRKVKEIGANNTHFVNPHGLYDDDQYTTPYDMYLIANYAAKMDKFMEIVTTSAWDIGPTNKREKAIVTNRNLMMNKGGNYYYEPIRGIKTGTLEQSGGCFVSTATKDGFTYLLVLMGAPLTDAQGNDLTEKVVFTETKKLYEWAFDSFQIKTVTEVGQLLKTVPVHYGKDKKDSINLKAGKAFSLLMEKDIDVDSLTQKSDVPEALEAPIEKGKEYGTMKYSYAGKIVGSVPLIAAEDIEESKLLYALSVVQNFFGHFAMKFLLVTLLIFFILYITAMVIRNYNKKRYAAARAARAAKKKRKR